MLLQQLKSTAIRRTLTLRLSRVAAGRPPSHPTVATEGGHHCRLSVRCANASRTNSSFSILPKHLPEPSNQQIDPPRSTAARDVDLASKVKFSIDPPKNKAETDVTAKLRGRFHEQFGKDNDDYFTSAYKPEKKLLKDSDGINSEWWTASFSCPATGQVFYSVDQSLLPSYISSDKLPSNIKSKEVNGIVYYKKKKTAELACSVSVLHHLETQNFWESKELIDPLHTTYSLLPDSSKEDTHIAQQQQNRVSTIDPIIHTQNPTASLQNQFIQHFGQEKKDDFDSAFTYTVKQSDQTFWTCYFSCPVTGQIFHPCSEALFLSYKFKDSRPSSDSIEEDGIMYYAHKKSAERACSIAVLNHLENHNMWENSRPRLIKDSQEEMSNVSLIPESSKPELNEQTLEGSAASDAQLEHSGKMVQLHSLYNPHVDISNVLNACCVRTRCTEWYDADQLKSVPIYTSVFQSPITGEVFSSGTLSEHQNQIVTDVPDTDRVYYRDRNMSIEAANARGLDCFHYRGGWLNDGDSYRFPPVHFFEEYSQLCTEEPYDSNSGYQVHELPEMKSVIDFLKVMISRHIPEHKDFFHFEYSAIQTEDGRSYKCQIVCPITQQTIAPKDDEVFENAKQASIATVRCVLDYYSEIGIWNKVETSPENQSGPQMNRTEASPIESTSVEPNDIGAIASRESYKDPSKNPTSIINLLHQACDPSVPLINSFEHESIRIENDKGIPTTYFHATFKSPITGEVFKTGTLNGVKSSDVFIEGDKVLYTTKKMATHAAAGRALDCFSLRNNWISPPGDVVPEGLHLSCKILGCNSNYCEEEPYHSADDTRVVFDIDNHYKAKNAEKEQSLEMHSAKAVINSRYQRILRSDQKMTYENSYIEIPSGKDGKINIYWNSTFVCPLTNESFSSGTLIELSNPNHLEDTASSHSTDKKSQVSDDSISSPIVIDDMVFYSNVKDAEHAAAGRAVDCMVHRNFWESFGIEGSVDIPRYCEEDPESISTHDEDDTLEEDDEYIIEHIPGSGISTDGSSDGRSNTMDTLFEAWVDDLSTSTKQYISTAHEEGYAKITTAPLPTSWSELLSMRDAALSNASSWYNVIEPSSDEKPKNMEPLFPNTRKKVLSNRCPHGLILKALGDANSIPQRLDSSASTDCETFAKKVLDRMICMVDTTDSAEPLSIDSFNDYIKCLHRNSAEETATAAESLLLSMINGDKFNGHPLPKPNIRTFNTVMNLWNKVPGSSNKVKTLYDQLQEIDYIKPDRDTLISKLVSLCNIAEDERVSSALLHAADVIEHIKHTGTADQGMEICIDTAVLNAPLPWSGGIRRIGDYISICEWDNYSTIYQHGFREIPIDPSCDVAYQEAFSIQEWLSNMKKDDGKFGNVSPDIETYESAIQAWVRTGTKNGMERAESLAVELMEAALHGSTALPRPRLQTFYPIIAGWVHCGDGESPARVGDWIERLDKHTDIPEIKPDVRTKLASLLAWKNWQANLHQNVSIETTEATTKPSPFSIAEQCSQLLSSSIQTSTEDLEMEQNCIDGHSFATVIDLWSNAIVDDTLGSKEKEASVSEMIGTIAMFDNLVDSYDNKGDISRKKENVAKHDDRDEKALSRKDLHPQFLKLLSESFSVYGAFVSQLSRIHSSSTTDDQLLAMGTKLNAVENMLRRSERILSILNDSTVGEGGTFEHFDLFKYDQSSVSSAHIHDLCVRTLTFCKELSQPTLYGDSVKIAMKVLKIVLENERRSPHDESTKVILQVVDVIESVVPDEETKSLILRQMLLDIEENNGEGRLDMKRILSSCQKYDTLKGTFGHNSKSYSSKADTVTQQKRRSHRKMRWPKGRSRRSHTG